MLIAGSACRPLLWINSELILLESVLNVFSLELAGVTVKVQICQQLLQDVFFSPTKVQFTPPSFVLVESSLFFSL